MNDDYRGPERRSIAPHDDIREAVAEGLKQAVSDPQFWEAASIAMRQQAQSAAGGWLLGGVRALLNRLGWMCLIAVGFYMLGGWGAVVAFFKTQGPPH